MSISDLKTCGHLLLLVGFINVAFAVKCFIMSIITTSTAGIIGSLAVFAMGVLLFLVICRRPSSFLVNFVLGLSAVFLILTTISLVCHIASVDLYFGVTEKGAAMFVVGMVIYTLEMFLCYHYNRLLVQFGG
ncbi:hypothetical protein HDE_04409 [Halotydeus destructor]|nr:hypothetical protein HDE_04409 [Halotydeus destructor]